LQTCSKQDQPNTPSFNTSARKTDQVLKKRFQTHKRCTAFQE